MIISRITWQKVARSPMVPAARDHRVSARIRRQLELEGIPVDD